VGSSFVLLLREGLEAALIIGIILGYLGKTGKKQFNIYVYGGALAGVAGSIIAAFVFNSLVGGFEGRVEEIFEGVIMLFAVCVLTYMIFWMHRQSREIGREIKAKVDLAVNNNQVYGLFFLAFLSVFREGVEVVLFFQATMTTGDKLTSLIGGFLGLIGAILIAYIIFRTSINLDLKTFFKITGGILILISAGLFARGTHELQEAGVLPIIVEHLYDINGILNEKGVIGGFLKSMFGYNGNPSLLEVVFYWGYLLIIGKKFLQTYKKTNKQA